MPSFLFAGAAGCLLIAGLAPGGLCSQRLRPAFFPACATLPREARSLGYRRPSLRYGQRCEQPARCRSTAIEAAQGGFEINKGLRHGTDRELTWLGAQVEELGRVVHIVCSEKIAELEAAVTAKA